MNPMKTLKRNAIKVFLLFVIATAFAIAGTGAKSAAEWPPASCREDVLNRASIIGTLIKGIVSGVQQEVVPRNSKCKVQKSSVLSSTFLY
jgi:hypothetical protein